MANRMIPIRKETASQFLPKEMRVSGGIDLHALAGVASKALSGSESSLAAAKQIADGNWIMRWWNNNEMQSHVIASIGFLRDISQVNLGLSAICNDLAEANLEHARQIDNHTQSTNEQLAAVQASTSQILDHLRKPKSPALLDGLIPALAYKDRETAAGWVKTLTDSINLQYKTTQDRVSAAQSLVQGFKVEHERIDTQVANLTAQVSVMLANFEADRNILQARITSVTRENEAKNLKLTKSIETVQAEGVVRASKQNATIKKSHELLSNALRTTVDHSTKRHAMVLGELKIQTDLREALNRTLLDHIAKREAAIHLTIHELNKHWLRRLVIVGAGLLTLLIGVFVFFAFKTNVF